MTTQKSNTREQIMNSLVTSIHKEARAATLFVHTVSEIVGIHSTDIRCLDFLNEVHSSTAGDLAKITGLTTGAITAVIDRLEKAGFVKRETDRSDRRKIIVRLIVRNPNNLKLSCNLFTKQIPNILSKYSTEELKLILDWNEKITTTFHNEIEKLKTSK